MPSASSDFDYEAALAACARGEHDALRALYERDAGWLHGVALRLLKRAELAEEIVHDAFVLIWTRAASFDPALGSGRGWVYSVLRYRALEELRSRQHANLAAAVEIDEVDIAAPASAAADDTLALLNGDALARCMARLDQAKQRAIVLAFVDGCSHEQVAQQLATPLGTVKSWIRRGLISLKECLA